MSQPDATRIATRHLNATPKIVLGPNGRKAEKLMQAWAKAIGGRLRFEERNVGDGPCYWEIKGSSLMKTLYGNANAGFIMWYGPQNDGPWLDRGETIDAMNRWSNSPPPNSIFQMWNMEEDWFAEVDAICDKADQNALISIIFERLSR